MKHTLWPLLLVLTACAVGPAHRPPTFDLAPTFHEARDTVVITPAAPPVAFWQTLGDSTLERLIGEALVANRDVRVALARARGARAARLDAALGLAPTITASGGYTRQRLASATFPGASGTFPDQDVWDAGLYLSWELDIFGRVRRSVQGQGALVASAQEDVRDVQVLLAAELASAYFELRGAQDRLAVAERNAENQRRTLDLTLQRLEAGRGNALDTERARAQLSSTLAIVPAQEATIAAIQYRIGVLVGRPPAAVTPELAGDARAPALPEAIAVASPDSVVHARPDVRSAERQLAARTAFVGAAIADYLPRLTVGGAAGYTGSTFESLGTTSTRRYAVGPVVSWPLFNLGRVKAGVDAARAGEAEAGARYEQTVLRALEEVETSLVTYRKARERLQRLEEAAAASERAAGLARMRFEEGASDFLQVLDAERTLLDAQDRRALGRTDATAGLVAVYRALGGSWPITTTGPR
jgi:NodT family efflux transporter outer membrane factor (OMF) lipoprotein